jgi:hypothetical protein
MFLETVRMILSNQLHNLNKSNPYLPTTTRISRCEKTTSPEVKFQALILRQQRTSHYYYYYYYYYEYYSYLIPHILRRKRLPYSSDLSLWHKWKRAELEIRSILVEARIFLLKK